jgi:hypothetical protein
MPVPIHSEGSLNFTLIFTGDRLPRQEGMSRSGIEYRLATPRGWETSRDSQMLTYQVLITLVSKRGNSPRPLKFYHLQFSLIK